jgi:hypothetical protein
MAIAFVLVLCQAVMQEPLPDPATYRPDSSEEAVRLEKAWIHSSDPRLVAWGGYLIVTESRRELIPELIEWLGAIENIGRPLVTDWEGYHVPNALVEALIRLDARVPVDLVMQLALGPRL